MPFAPACCAAPAAAAACAPHPVLASTAVRAALSTASHGRVLAVFPTALYVQVGEMVLAVVTSDGLRLPNALVVAVPARTTPFARHGADDGVEVRDDTLHVGATSYRPARWWSPRGALPGHVPAPLPARVVELADRLRAVAPAHDVDVEQALARAARALHESLAVGSTPPAAATACAAADEVLGLGPGLTPSGDDLLAGVLVACAQLGAAELVQRLGRHVSARAGERTTALSATLLRCATDGLAAQPVLGLVDALVGQQPLEPALQALLAVGHTSGHDTARGVHVAAAALLEHGTAGAPPPGSADIQEDT